MLERFGRERTKILWKSYRPQLPRNVAEADRLYQQVPRNCGHGNKTCPTNHCDEPQCLHFQHDFCSRGDKCPLCHCTDGNIGINKVNRRVSGKYIPDINLMRYAASSIGSSASFGQGYPGPSYAQQRGTGFIQALQEVLPGFNSGYAKVNELIQAKADVNQTCSDPFGREHSVLTMAVSRNDATLTKMLCEAKADVASQVGEYSSPVRLAYETGRQDSWQVLAFFPECYMAPDITLEIVKMLVAAQTDINWADVKGQTALHHHAAAGRFEAASCLVQLNARIDQKDVEGKAPIHVVKEVTDEWLLLLAFVQLINLAGDEMALPISEVTFEDFAHCVRRHVQDYYQEKGRRVSYFSIRMMVGSLGHA